MKPMKIRDRLKIGQYEPLKAEKDVNEPFCKSIKWGQIYWTIKMSKYGLFDVEREEDAVIISRLVSIERKLDKLLRKS